MPHMDEQRHSRESTDVGRTRRRRAILAAVVIGWTLVAAAPAGAASEKLSGVGVLDRSGIPCPGPPAQYSDFVDFPPLLLTGSLEGCWYTNVDTFKDNGAPSGIYLETGREVFVGSLNGGPDGVFATTYRFESKWDPDVSSGPEVRGRCQHPVVKGSGTGGFAGVTGRVDFKDVVADGTYLYRGHLSVP
jgi:hypothetical protein